MTSPRPAPARQSKPRSPCSGSRAPRCSGIGSPEPSPPSRGLDLVGAGPPVRAAQHGASRMATSATFETKYHYNYWRPGHRDPECGYRRQPENERRPDVDPAGRRLRPIPDYDSAHSVAGRRGSAGPQAVLRHRSHQLRDLQPDACRQAARATTRHPVLRRYTSFSQAAEENGLSRILVGFHFRKAVERGDRARPQDRRPRRGPVHAARGRTGSPSPRT